MSPLHQGRKQTLGFRISGAAADYSSEVIKIVEDHYTTYGGRSYEARISETMHLLGMLHQVTLAEVREVLMQYKYKVIDGVNEDDS